MFELFPDENGAKLTSVGAGQHLPSSFGRGCLVPSFVAELEARAAAAPLLDSTDKNQGQSYAHSAKT